MNTLILWLIPPIWFIITLAMAGIWRQIRIALLGLSSALGIASATMTAINEWGTIPLMLLILCGVSFLATACTLGYDIKLAKAKDKEDARKEQEEAARQPEAGIQPWVSPTPKKPTKKDKLQ